MRGSACRIISCTHLRVSSYHYQKNERQSLPRPGTGKGNALSQALAVAPKAGIEHSASAMPQYSSPLGGRLLFPRTQGTLGNCFRLGAQSRLRSHTGATAHCSLVFWALV